MEGHYSRGEICSQITLRARLTPTPLQWAEGFQTIRQSHLIGAEGTSTSDSDLLLLAVSSYTTEIRESILVFDHSHWEADHGLWLSVQKVCLFARFFRLAR